MYSLKLYSIAGILLLSFNYLKAQKVQDVASIDSVTFKVAGVCEMCKERIENAALIKGVKYTEWNKLTKDLLVIYKTDKVTHEELHRAVTEFGHDTEKAKANKDAYEKLPFCCEYREGQKTH